MKDVFKNPAAYRKFIAAVIGAVGVAITQGLLPAIYGDWLSVVIAFTTALGVYGIYNDGTEHE